jgi:hypothetical protein
VRRALLPLAAAAVVALPASAASLPARSYLGLAASGTAILLQSADGVRWSPVPGYRARPGTSPVPLRRGSTLYLYDAPAISAGGLGGTVRRFTVATGGRLAEQHSAPYHVELAAPEDALRATPDSFAPAFAVDPAGKIVLLYALRFETGTNACPVVAKACVKLRTATEAAGTDGVAFNGDAGNRIVISLDPADATGPPSLLRTRSGWAVLLQGPGGCLQLLTAKDPHGVYRNGGCLLDQGPGTPSALYDARLGVYRLYGLLAGQVVRAVIPKLDRFAPARLRPLAALGSRLSAARVASASP